jgi:hypothetical protein
MTSRHLTVIPMIGSDAFCPESGAPLSEEHHYDETGRAWRAVTPDDHSPADAPDGLLTAGAVRSSRTALWTYFRRCATRHDVPDACLRTAALGLRRLKRAGDGRTAPDVHVWYALQHRLSVRGYDADWMGSHAKLRCPDCHGRLRYGTAGDRLVARCGTLCGDDPGDRLPAVREAVAALYADAFDDRPDPTTLLQG